MSVDEMIKALNKAAEVCYMGGSSDLVYPLSRVADALRAGERMRDCFEPIDDRDDASWAVCIKRGDLSVAGQAWDAATKEDV